MRVRYSKVRLVPNLDFSAHLIDAAASFDGDPKKSAIYDVLKVWDFTTLIERYHEKAERNSEKFGCANCLGIEVLRSCLCARVAVNDPELNALADLNALAVAYPNIAAMSFGGSPTEWYREGLKHNDTSYNLMNKPSYSRLKTQDYKSLVAQVEEANQYRGGNEAKLIARKYAQKFMAVTKPSANAHAVLSRAELEGCVRYALCEFLLASLGNVEMRTEISVRNQAVQLAVGTADPGTVDSDVSQAWTSFSQQLERTGPSGGAYAGYLEYTLALDLLGWLTKQMAAVMAKEGSAAQRRAALVGLCALVRHRILSVSRRTRKFAPALGDFMGSLIPVLCAASTQGNLGDAVCDAKKMKEELGKSVAAGRAAAGRSVINDVGLTWATEDSVEFAHQCGICESEQGDGSLIRRVVDHYATVGNTAPNPIFGITYADLSITDASGDTVWDLSSAVVCQAVEVLMNSVHQALKRTRNEADKDFLLSLIYHCNNTPWLFVAYFEVLFLEMAYSDPDPDKRRVVRVLAPA
ncbi:MAG: hypothetical protein QM784_09310 [Polyangiaceae bacterium]